MSQLVTRPGIGAITTVNDRPLLSAILITSNSESHLRECLHGLLEQSVADRIEIIIVDEGSDQCEWAVAADLQRRHHNILSLKLPPQATGRGVNMAVNIASGKYLTIIDATDRLRRDAYEQLAAALEHNPGAMLAYGDTCFTAVPHESFANHTSYGKVIWPDYSLQQLAQLSEVAPHLLWRRELHDSVGLFPEGYPNHGVREFLIKVVERFRIMHIQEFTGLKLIAAKSQAGQAAEPAAAPFREEAPRRAEPVAANLQPEPTPAAPAYARDEPAAAPVVIPPQTAEEAYLQLRPLLDGPDQQKTTEQLRKHLALYPRHAVAHNDLAALSYQVGDKEQALKHYREAVWLEPEENTYLKNLADLLYVEAGEVDEAIGIYLKLLEKSPRDIETLLNLGIICEGVGQPGEAESFYQRALEIDPANQMVRGRLKELRNRTEEREAPDEEPVEDRYQRSQELVAQENLEGAELELQGILCAYPDFAPAHNDLAVLSYQKGDKENARSHYEQAAALAPGNSTFQKNLADFMFVEGGDVDGAIAIYLKQLEKEPKNVETLMSLGKICTILERPQEAESFYGKVTQLEPWNRDARECLTTLRQAANG